MTYTVSGETLNPTHSLTRQMAPHVTFQPCDLRLEFTKIKSAHVHEANGSGTV